MDLLTYLGVEKGQWKAVTWLLTRIIDRVWKNSSDKTAELPGPWKGKQSLQEMTAEAGLYLDSPTGLPFKLLDDLTESESPLHDPLESNFAHETLGIVWRSLGNMIIADAARTDKPENTITPEILEIIALLHHHGIMPSSIYSYQPSDDLNALRQPPTLHLLSSHILTSLSDAAWRAHESLVVEEAKAQGGEYLSMRPEIPGSMYKVHVAGLGHEVWLELVLWSCLHGKWIEEGASILQNVTRDRTWSALSWRELAAPLMKPGQEKSINWDDLSYRLNAGHIYGDPSLTTETKNKVKRTLSVEIIAAFVDALLDVTRTNVGARGVPAAQVLQFINQFKSFLDRNRLSLGSTSWDVVVYRFFDSGGIDMNQEPALAERIVRLLSSEFGEELSASNAPARNEEWQPLPSYVLDGTAVAMGLMHRVLQSYIQSGNIGGALRTFEELQHMTDRNKQKSIKDFFKLRAEKGNISDDTSDVDFESPLAGIEYPAFYPQLPASILAPFLDLITESGSFQFGKWLLHSDDIDGPVITEAMWIDPLIGAALIRFASAIEDPKFLIKLLQKQGESRVGTSNIPPSSLLALLEGQVYLKKWDVVDTILNLIKKEPGYPVEGRTVTTLARAVLREIDARRGPLWDRNRKENVNIDRAFKALGHVTLVARQENPRLFSRARTTLMVLGCIDKKWERVIVSLSEFTAGSQRYAMTASSFDIILDGVLSKYGSDTGRTFLGRFWRAAVDQSITAPPEVSEDEQSGVARMSAERPGPFVRLSHHDISITLGKAADDMGRKPPRLYGVFTPSINTVNTVLRHSLKEYLADERRKQWSIDWARRMLRLVGLRSVAVEQEIQRIRDQVEGDKKAS